ncbi:MAG: hypothetical protein ABSD53_11975 [Terriglobales bacterium]
MNVRCGSTMLLLAVITALTLTLAVQPTQAQDSPSQLPKRLVADYTAGSKYLDPPYDVPQIPFKKLTHIIHAGVPWNSDGSLSVPDGFVEPQLIKRARKWREGDASNWRRLRGHRNERAGF